MAIIQVPFGTDAGQFDGDVGLLGLGVALWTGMPEKEPEETVKDWEENANPSAAMAKSGFRNAFI